MRASRRAAVVATRNSSVASAATSTADVSGVGTGLLSWLGSGDGGFPAAAPLMWAVAAVTRRDSETASANATANAAAPNLLRFLIGDGTAGSNDRAREVINAVIAGPVVERAGELMADVVRH